MHRRVGRVRELIRHEIRRILGQDAFRFLDRPFHSFPGRCQDKLCAIRRQQAGPLHTHTFRHDKDQLVSAHRCDEGQSDPGVAAGRFHDGSAGFEFPLPLRLIDHVEADPVLDAASGIEKFDFPVDRGGTLF